MEGSNETSVNGASRVLTAPDARATDHLNKLAERNRVKRVRNAKSREQQAQEQLERGFTTHFRGANASPGDSKSASGSKDVTKVFVSGKSPHISRMAAAAVPGGDMRQIRGILTATDVNNAASAPIYDTTEDDVGDMGPKLLFADTRQDRYTAEDDDELDEYLEQGQVQEHVHEQGFDEDSSDNNLKDGARALTQIVGISSSEVAHTPAVILDAELLNNVAALSPEQQAALLQFLVAGGANNSLNVNRSTQPSALGARPLLRSPTCQSPIITPERSPRESASSSNSPPMHQAPLAVKLSSSPLDIKEQVPSHCIFLRGQSPILKENEQERPSWLQRVEAPVVPSTNNSTGESERPSWLPKNSAPSKSLTLADSETSVPIAPSLIALSTSSNPSRSRPSSGRRPSPFRPEEYEPSVRLKTPTAVSSIENSSSPGSGSSATSSARRRRRKDSKQAGNIGSAHLDSLLGAGRREPGSEEVLRQSLAAMSLADKTNLGRIPAGGITMDDDATLQVGLNVSRSLFTSESRANLQHTQLTREMGQVQQSQVESGPIKPYVRVSSHDKIRQGSRSNLLGNTVKRNIDITNEKVQNAMADLKGVLSGFQEPVELSASKSPPLSPNSELLNPSLGKDSRVNLIGSEVKRRIESTTEHVDGAMIELHDVLSGLHETSSAVKRNPSKDVLRLSKDSGLPTLATASDRDVVEFPQYNLEESMSFDMVRIPILPAGRVLTLEVLSTWGDPHYVGLAGLDIFDESGAILITDPSTNVLGSFEPTKITASVRSNACIVGIRGDPPDINVLPEYGSDPRTVHNLLDGNSFTRDDLHVWLAPLGFCEEEPGLDGMKPHAVINIVLSKPTTISMVRIFNYNKSRTHAARGVRLCRFSLDGIPVFQGEVRMAPGLLSSPDQVSETILFTTDTSILTEIALHDESRGYYVADATSSWVSKLLDRHKAQRPRTADENGATTISRHRQAPEGEASEFVNSIAIGPRPVTQAALAIQIPVSSSNSGMKPSRSTLILPTTFEKSGEVVEHKDFDDEEKLFRELRELGGNSSGNDAVPESLFDGDMLRKMPCETFADVDAVLGVAVRLYIESAWDPAADYVGLMGIQVLLTTGAVYVAPSAISVETSKSCGNDTDYMGDDARTVGNLVNGINDCTDDKNAWLTPFVPSNLLCLVMCLPSPDYIVGLRIWNYNKVSMPEFVLRGVRTLRIVIMNKSGEELPIGRAIVRPGPGSDCLQFAQTILLRDVSSGLHCGPDLSRAPLATLGATSTVPRYVAPSVNQDYEAPRLPCGMMWRIVISENWNDGYFVGLDGLELFDHTGARIVPDIHDKIVAVTAFPNSVNDLPILSNEFIDPRTPDRLLFTDDNNRPGGSTHQPWLAPLAQCMSQEEKESVFRKHMANTAFTSVQVVRMNVSADTNSIYLLFQYPVALSAVRFYNYSKAPARGVRHFSMHCDHKLVFMGSLLSADKEKMMGGQRRGQAVIFSAHPRVVKADRDIVSYSGATDQDVLCVNERKVMVRSRSMYANTPNVAADGVFSDLSQRPHTSAVQVK